MQRVWMLVCLVAVVPLLRAEDEDVDPLPCGDVTANKGTLDLSKLGDNNTCTWRFTSNKTERFFTFKTFDLGPGEQVTVYDNDPASKAVKLTGNFTGKRDPFLAVTFSNVSAIVYSRGSSKSNTSKLVVLYNTAACQMHVMGKSGVIRTPTYYPTPQGTLSCLYHVMTNVTKGNVIMTFDDVNIAKGDITAWDGDAKNGSVLLNATGPVATLGDVMASGAKALVQVTLPTSKVENFTAMYFAANQACPKGAITLTAAMNLTSSGYPAKYPNNVDCRFLITAPEGTTIDVKVTDLDLGDTVDDVVLNDGDNKQSPMLANLNADFKQSGFLLTSGNKLWVRMRTDESRTGRGFSLLLTPKDYGGAGRGEGQVMLRQKPTGDVIARSGDVKLPIDVYYTFYATEGMQVRLTVNESTVHPVSSIEVRDGTALSSPLVAYFRTDQPYYPVMSTSGSLLLVAKGFIETNRTTEQKLIVNFNSVTSGGEYSLSGDSGSATLKEAALNNSASWVIVNPSTQNRTVALEIHELYVPQNAVVKIYGGSKIWWQFISYTTGPSGNPVKVVPVIYAPQFKIVYEVTGKPAVVPEKVLLRFSFRIIQGCDGAELSTPSGDFIASPLYPNLYPANAKCSWTFTPAKDKLLRLAFSDVSLAANHSLTVEADHYSIITVGNKSVVNVTTEVLKVMSHHLTDIPDVIIPMNNDSPNTTKVKVTFDSSFNGQSSDLQVSSGFKVNYEHLQCGGNITDPSQALSTPGWPKAINASMARCIWVVSLPAHPASSNTSVNIVSFKIHIKDFTPNTNKSKTLIQIRDGPSETAPMIPIPLKDGDSADILSLTNQLWIMYTFNRSDNKTFGFPFQLSYSTHECGQKDLCDNGICMHSDWRCNGKDECGDDSDERDCYHASNTVSRLVLGLAIVITFILATVLACVVPALYKRFKYPNYSELRDLMTPVPT